VSEQPNRWILKVVLVIAVASLVGVLAVPFVNAGFTSSVQPTSTPQQEELESQIKGYELVLQREPDNQVALKGLVDSWLKLVTLKLQTNKLSREDVALAIPPLERLTRFNPREVRYGVLLAQYKQYVGDREGAAQAYRAILANRPGEQLALQGLVGLLMEQKRPEAAIGLLKDTLKLAPQANQTQPGSVDVISVQLILGQVYELQNRYDEAIAVYDAAIKVAPDDFRPLFGKAIVLSNQGKIEEAKPLFTKAESLASPQYKDQIKQEALKAVTKATQAPSASADSATKKVDANEASLDNTSGNSKGEQSNGNALPSPSLDQPVASPPVQ
jgi:tetratricopeptide (TPR) repeat protein